MYAGAITEANPTDSGSDQRRRYRESERGWTGAKV
jgi:hypothetical protein